MTDNPCQTGCTCSGPGWCERHKMRKTDHLYDLCRCDQRYFDLWERMAADEPDIIIPRERPKLGDQLHDWLESKGITEDWYKQMKQKFGLPPHCNCEARRQWLNKVSDWWRGEQDQLSQPRQAEKQDDN